MKKLPFLVALALATAQAQAQPVVIAHTPDLDKITIENHLEEIAKLGAIIEQMTTTKDWLGNAAQIVEIAGADFCYIDLLKFVLEMLEAREFRVDCGAAEVGHLAVKFVETE